MRITVLGMWGGFPRAGEATSGYLVESAQGKVLLDCGSGVLSRLLLHTDIKDLDAIVLSHYHADHCSDVGVLQYARLVAMALAQKEATLPIYCFDDQKEFYKLSYKEEKITKGIAYQEGKSFQIKDLTFEPFKTLHAVECYGFRFTDGLKTVCYTADGGFTHTQIKMAQSVDLLISEANFSQRDETLAEGNHMTGRQAGEVALQAGAAFLLLTHLPPLGDEIRIYEEAQKVFGNKVALAKTDFKIDL